MGFLAPVNQGLQFFYPVQRLSYSCSWLLLLCIEIMNVVRFTIHGLTSLSGECL